MSEAPCLIIREEDYLESLEDPVIHARLSRIYELRAEELEGEAEEVDQ
jgi:hypothetical protein